MTKEKLLIGKSSGTEYRNSISLTSTKLTVLLPRLREIVKVDTAETWQDILSGATRTRSELKANIETELSQISIPVFRDEMKVKMNTVIETFEELVNKVANSFNLNPSFIPRSFYQLSGNSIVCSKEADTLIDEETNIYISDPEELQAYELCQKVAPLLTELYGICHKYRMGLFNSLDTLGILTRNEKGEYSANLQAFGFVEGARKKEEWQQNRKQY